MKYAFILLSILALIGSEGYIEAQQQGGQSQAEPEIEQVVHVVSHNNNVFALQIYPYLKQGKNAMVFSPFSLSTSLAMLYQGAEGMTQSQISRIARFQIKISYLNKSFSWMIDQFLKRPKSYEDLWVNAGNSLWVQKGPAVTAAFESTLKDTFKSPLKRTDFASRPEQVIQEVNAWIRDRSHGRISRVIQPGELNNTMNMLLVSSLYMRGKWKTVFNPQATKQVAYFPNSSVTSSLPMMTVTGLFRFYKDAAISLIELPYENRREDYPEISMFIVLPRETFGLDSIEEGLTFDRLESWMDGMQPKIVVATIPKFKISSTIDFKDSLKKIGLVEPFAEYANFSGIDGGRDLKLGKAIQRALLSIDEKGSDAGVATSPGLPVIGQDDNITETFLADHPFMFFVMDKTSGSILLLGRYVSLPSIDPE